MYFRFYCECILPEIIDPQYGKRMLKSDIIEPDFILKAQKKNCMTVKTKNIKQRLTYYELY